MPDAPDPDYDPNSATIPLSGPRPTLSGSNVDLPLPEELAKLLPAGAYELTGFLGAGGMGAVYKGMQIRLKRPVAIKIMRAAFNEARAQNLMDSNPAQLVKLMRTEKFRRRPFTPDELRRVLAEADPRENY